MLFSVHLQLKVAQGANYNLEESVTMETELIELRAQKQMTALQVKLGVCKGSLYICIINNNVSIRVSSKQTVCMHMQTYSLQTLPLCR